MTLTIFDFFTTYVVGRPKKTVHEVLDFLKNLVRSISPKKTKKTEHDTAGRYRFG